MTEPRCPECGSWGVECANPAPVAECGCARCAGAALAEARREVARLQRAEATFHEEYRQRCDAETKALHAEVARLRADVHRCAGHELADLVDDLREQLQEARDAGHAQQSVIAAHEDARRQAERERDEARRAYDETCHVLAKTLDQRDDLRALLQDTVPKLIPVVRTPNIEYVADEHNAARDRLRGALDAALGGR